MRLEEYDYTGAIALAVVLLMFSFVLLGAINLLEQWSSRFELIIWLAPSSPKSSRRASNRSAAPKNRRSSNGR